MIMSKALWNLVGSNTDAQLRKKILCSCYIGIGLCPDETNWLVKKMLLVLSFLVCVCPCQFLLDTMLFCYIGIGLCVTVVVMTERLVLIWWE